MEKEMLQLINCSLGGLIGICGCLLGVGLGIVCYLRQFIGLYQERLSALQKRTDNEGSEPTPDPLWKVFYLRSMEELEETLNDPQWEGWTYDHIFPSITPDIHHPEFSKHFFCLVMSRPKTDADYVEDCGDAEDCGDDEEEGDISMPLDYETQAALSQEISRAWNEKLANDLAPDGLASVDA